MPNRAGDKHYDPKGVSRATWASEARGVAGVGIALSTKTGFQSLAECSLYISRSSMGQLLPTEASMLIRRIDVCIDRLQYT
ncbi:unnamed protein product [Echinostoma caproni]|uniref:Uncharacterized protein n=1 Tax=Echinostoma caproni TaxID=27848 RepID=A0A183AY04_9TREM|nr:unnamed protein product [Echinostoma caproni]